MTPHQRLGKVDDIASTVAFLCSDGGSFINGQTIVVDGGWSSTKYLSDFALNSEWVARVEPVRLCSTRPPRASATAARCITVSGNCIRGQSCGSGRCGWRLAPRARARRARDRGRQREPPGDHRADVRRLGGGMRVRADQLQTASARDAADPRRCRRRTGFRVAEDRRRSSRPSPTFRSRSSATKAIRRRLGRRARSAAPQHRSGRHWRGCSTPAEPPAGPRARCCRTAT